MQQLFLNEIATTLFFSDNATFDDIFEWVQEQVMFDNTNLFNLNEQHSCSVSNGLDGSITINGDEDRAVLTIETLTPIL